MELMLFLLIALAVIIANELPATQALDWAAEPARGRRTNRTNK